MSTDYLFCPASHFDDQRTFDAGELFGLEPHTRRVIKQGVERGYSTWAEGRLTFHRDPARHGWWIVRAGTTSIVVDGAEIDLARLGEGQANAPRYAVKLIADAKRDEPGFWCDTLRAAEHVAKGMNGGRRDYELTPLRDDSRFENAGR